MTPPEDRDLRPSGPAEPSGPYGSDRYDPEPAEHNARGADGAETGPDAAGADAEAGAGAEAAEAAGADAGPETGPGTPGEPQRPRHHKKKMVIAAVLVLLTGALAAFLLVRMKPEPERREPEVRPPLVRVVEVTTRPVALDVESQGTVQPVTESTLVAQVAGRIVAVDESFASGGFFRRGETLVQIDPADYRLAIEDAEAAVAQARLLLEREEAEAEVARAEWEELGTGEPSALVLRRPQLAEARARLAAARAAVERARLNLARTTVEAPFDGRLRQKQADLGQYVAPGTPLATVFGTEVAEVRLPVEKRDLRFLDVELGAESGNGAGPPVTLSAELGGLERAWQGRIVRTSGEVDPKTSMVDLFARVRDPYRRGAGEGAPLPVGLFVEADISGRTIPGAAVLPRAALRPPADGRGEQVLVVDAEGRLRARPVEVLQTRGEEVVISSGLADGDLVVVSRLEEATEGMEVRVTRNAPEDAPDASEPTEGSL